MSPIATSTSASSTSTSVPSSANSAGTGVVERRVLRRVGGADDHALAQLHRGAGQEPVDGPVRVGRPEVVQRHAAQDRGDRARLGRDLLGHRGQLRRLVAEDDEVGAPGELRVGGHHLAADLGGERRGPVAERIGAQQRAAPSASEAARHVSRSDEPDLHRGRHHTGPHRRGRTAFRTG